MPDNEIVSNIAQKIRAIRLKKSLTIKQLAERTNVSKGLLSKIENSRTIPSLPVFVQILQSLDISFKEFFEDITLREEKNYFLIRKNDYKAIKTEGASDLDYRHIVTKIIPTASVEISLVNVKPGSNARARTSDGFMFKYVVNGLCEYILNKEVIPLSEGDSIFFNGSIPHLPTNKSDRDALMLVVDFRF